MQPHAFCPLVCMMLQTYKNMNLAFGKDVKELFYREIEDVEA